MCSVSFGAKFIQNKMIYKRDDYGKYLPEKVSIAEVDPYNVKDLLFLRALGIKRGDYSYAECLFSDAAMNIQIELKGIIQKILILTSQNENFENMSEKDVKGFISYNKYPKDSIRVNYLEGFPNSFFNVKDRKYKHIGKVLFNSMLELEKPKSLSLHSTTMARSFYESLGLKKNPASDSNYEFVLFA